MALIGSASNGTFLLRVLHAVLLVVLSICRPALADERTPQFFDLGPTADHYLDRSGKLTIIEMAGNEGDRLLVHPNGRAANYGPRPNPEAAMWLRITLPQLKGQDTDDWILSVDELRLRKVTLFLSEGGIWREQVWDGAAHGVSGNTATRFPVYPLSAANLSARTIFLKVETASSMRAKVTLTRAEAFTYGYAHQSLMFGFAIGLLSVLVVSLFAAGIASRDRNALTLSAFALAYLIYLVSHQAFLETHLWPGSLWLSRIASLTAVMLIFATLLYHIDAFLGVKMHAPTLSRTTRWLGLLFVVLAAIVAIETGFKGQSRLRLVTAPMGLGAIGYSLMMLFIMAFRTPRRVALFALCWLPVLLSGIARMVHDAFPGVGVSPAMLNATNIVICLGFLVSGIVSAMEMHWRERARRLASESQGRRLEDIARIASDSFWETDERGVLTHVAGPVAWAAGFEVGKPLDACLHQIDGRSADARSQTLDRGGMFRTMLKKADPAGGRENLLELRGRPYTIAGSDSCGYRGVITDITDEVERQANEAQQHRLAAMGQLAGGIAHDINNLLHPIINLSRRVAEEVPPTDHKRRWLNAVVDAGLRAAEIVSSLLAAVKPKTSDASAVTFLEGIRRSLAALSPITPNNIQLEFDNDGETGPVVAAQEAFQIAVNLVSNAIYASHGTGRITISLKRDPTGRPGETIFSVTDEGEGMDDETRRRALEPFFTRKAASDGTGLGLSIVHGIVQRLGGSLSIHSSLGNGTTVTLKLPRTAETVLEPAQ